MPDDQINLLRSAVSGLADIVSTMISSAKPEQINFAQKDELNQRLSSVRGSLETVAINGADPIAVPSDDRPAVPSVDEHDRS